jgi:sec-independent protein translocase protein TatC
MIVAEERSMGLFEHIRELRQRLFRSIIVWIIATLGASMVVDQLISWLVAPAKAAGSNVSIIVTSPPEGAIIYFKVALAAGFALALPYVLYEIYRFIAPGLYRNERRVFITGIPAVLIFFILGAIFTLQLLIPTSLPVLMGFLGDVVEPMYMLDSYLSFVTTLVVWMGLIFQTPLIVFIIARLGLVTPKQLAGARRIVWFLAVVFAAVITPTTDPVTLLLVTGPFIGLYEIGLLLSHIAARQRSKDKPEELDS